jgi:hypothetical protein
MNILQRPEVTRNSIPPEMADFGSGQSRNLFATTIEAALRRGLQKDENAGLNC